MLKTLKAQNNSIIKLGNLQVQPVVSDVSLTVKKASLPATLSQAPIPAAQVQFSAPVVVLTPPVPATVQLSLTLPSTQSSISTPVNNFIAGTVAFSAKSSLVEVAALIVSNPNFSVPALNNTFNNILPSYALNLTPSFSFNKRAVQSFTTPVKKFEPYEQLTNISQERPEVIMMSGFLPLFDKSSDHSRQSYTSAFSKAGIHTFMTDTGQFVDVQIQIRNLRSTNAINLLRNLKQQYVNVDNEFISRTENFKNSLLLLQESTDFLLSLFKSLDTLKSQLDLRDALYVADPDLVLNSYVTKNSMVRLTSVTQKLSSYVRQYMPATYSMSDVLVRLGYDINNVYQFSSTKMWLQLLLELKSILTAHSLEFLDIDPVQQRADANATVLTQSSAKLFNMKNSLPSLPVISELINVQQSNVPEAISVLQQAFASIYEDVSFRSEEARIAALGHLISREYRYSKGLSDSRAVKLLNDKFAFSTVDVGNVDVFDAIIGDVGNNITDIPSSTTNTLASISQQKPTADVAVLTFESKFIDGDSGTLSPGSSYFIDDMVLTTDGIKFDTSKLDKLSSMLSDAHKTFSTITNSMNLLSTTVSDSSDPSTNQYVNTIQSPTDLIRSFTNQLVDDSGNTLPVVRDDPLGAVYARAMTDNKTKTILFLYTLCRMNRAYTTNVFFLAASLTSDNTPLTETLVDELIVALDDSTSLSNTSLQALQLKVATNNMGADSLTKDSIKSAMKTGTKLTTMIEDAMSKLLSAFRIDQIIVGNKTKYSGCVDTIIAMMMFDMVIAIIAKYSNQTLASKHFGRTSVDQGVLTFVVAKTSLNNADSIRDLRNRTEREIALTHQLIYAIFDSLDKLSNSTTGFSNFLNSPDTRSKLQSVSNIIDDPKLLHMLLGEQQVSLLASSVYDLIERSSQQNIPSDNSSDSDPGFISDGDIKFLDDSVFSPRLRDAFYGFFNNEQLASSNSNKKKIVTVGIPLGFTQRLKQRINVNALKKSSFANKQNDIIKVVVYKVDLENSDIVYKPKKMLFELSRFPVRNDARYLPIPDSPTISDVVQAIPTRDFQQTGDGNSVTYGNTTANDLAGTYKTALGDETYGFLSAQQKSQLLYNHVSSHLLEVYTKLLTGMNVADFSFDIVSPPKPTSQELIKLVVDHHFDRMANALQQNVASPGSVVEPVGGVLFTTTMLRNNGTPNTIGGNQPAQKNKPSNSAGVAGNVSFATQFKSISQANQVQKPLDQLLVANAAANVSRISHRDVSTAVQDFSTISSIADSVTTLSDPTAVAKKLLKPKQFDRVFSFLVDPDEFEVDHDLTVQTPHGKTALDQMIAKGNIVVGTENDSFASKAGSIASHDMSHEPSGRPSVPSNNAVFVHKTRNKNAGDVVLDKYFVTIETFDEADT